MVRTTKFRHLLAALILIVALTGCQLNRSDGTVADLGPVSVSPPTLAPLGAETEPVLGATAIPTIINVQPTATQSTDAEGQATGNVDEQTSPTSQPESLSGATVVSDEAIEEAASTSPETFVPPAEEVATEEIVAAVSVPQEAIVVDATTSDDLPIGGPVAANPPASQTSGAYSDVPAYGDANYTVLAGDTLFSIALRYGTNVETIALANGLPTDVIYAGQVLYIPGDDNGYVDPSYQQPFAPDAGQGQHIIAPGETLYRIALQYTTSVDAIAGANGIPYPYLIQAGQLLVIPVPGAYVPSPPAPADGYYEQPYQDYQSYPTYPTEDDSYVSVPGMDGTHTVAPGETLYSIALLYGTNADTLAATNGLYNPNQIYVGQVLYLP